MPVIDGLLAANENLLAVAKVGAAAAFSAPKMARTHIKVEIVTGEDLLPLIEIVGILGETNAFVRGDHVVAKKASEAGTPIVQLLIGVDATVSDLAWNCGGCGFGTCAEFNRYSKEHKSQGTACIGPSCQWKLLDHGMALSYAAAAISAMNVECRLHGDYGSAALLLGHMDGCSLCVGVSLGPGGESIWYNRSDLEHSFTMAEHEEFMHNTLPQLFIAFNGSGRPMVKFGPDWAAKPKFLKAMEDPEFMARKRDAVLRIGKIVEKERAKKAARKQG
jgi:uncharacterized ferredoxin-like protein